MANSWQSFRYIDFLDLPRIILKIFTYYILDINALD